MDDDGGDRGEGDSAAGARERLERVGADRISLFYDIVILRMRILTACDHHEHRDGEEGSASTLTLFLLTSAAS